MSEPATASGALVLLGRWDRRYVVQNQRGRGVGRALGPWGKAGTRDHGHICRKLLTAPRRTVMCQVGAGRNIRGLNLNQNQEFS